MAQSLPTFGFHTTSSEAMAALGPYAAGRTFAITGAAPKSLGAETILSLARADPAPAHIIVLARKQERVAPVLAEIASVAPSVRVTFVRCDLSEPDAVRAAANAVLEDASIPNIDVLINNAGSVLKKYSQNSRGVEMQLATNYCGPFLLTNLLLPKIVASGPGARIVNLSSMCHQISPFRFTDPMFTNGSLYDPWSGYGQSKTAEILFSVELARRLKPLGVSVFAVHPGVIRTNIRDGGMSGHDFHWLRPITVRNTGIDTFCKPFEWDFKTLAEGASSTLVAALDPRLEPASGAYVEDCNVGKAMAYASDPAAARVLWRMTEGWVGQRFDVDGDAASVATATTAEPSSAPVMMRARL